MSDEPLQNGTVPDEIEQEQIPKPKSGEEAKAARSMDAMQANKEQTASADVDDAKLATVCCLYSGVNYVGNDIPDRAGQVEERRRTKQESGTQERGCRCDCMPSFRVDIR
jgi:hypothetical protein